MTYENKQAKPSKKLIDAVDQELTKDMKKRARHLSELMKKAGETLPWKGEQK